MADDLLIRARLANEVSGPARAARKSVDDLADATKRADRAGRTAGRGGLAAAANGMGRLTGKGKELHRSLQNVSRELGTHLVRAARAGAIALGVAAVAVTGFGLKAASDIQMTRVGLEALTGSAEGAAGIFEYLKRLDPLAPFDIGQLSTMALQVGNIGLRGAELEAQLQGIVDVAALVPDRVGDIGYALNQIKGSPNLITQDLRQLIQAGVNVGAAMEQAFGISMGEFIDRQVAGERFDSGVFLEALFGQASGRAEKVATETLTGLLSGVRSRVLIKLSEAAGPLMQALQANLPTIEAGIGGIIDGLAPPLIKIASVILDLVVKALPLVSPLLTAVADGIGLLVSAAGPGLTGLQPVIAEIVVALQGLIGELLPVMPDLTRALVGLAEVAPDIVEIFADLVRIGAPLVALAADLLQFDAVQEVLAVLLVTLIGYRALAGIVGTLYAFAGGLTAIGTANTAGGLGAGAAGAAGRLGGPGGLLALLGIAGTGMQVHDRLQGPAGGSSLGQDLALIGTTTATGAAIGSIFPGIGTGIGAAGGAAVGTGIAVADRIGGWLGIGGNHSGATVAPAATAAPAPPAGVTSSTVVAPGGIVVYPQSQMDLEAGVVNGLRSYERERAERGA